MKAEAERAKAERAAAAAEAEAAAAQEVKDKAEVPVITIWAMPIGLSRALTCQTHEIDLITRAARLACLKWQTLKVMHT